MNNSQSSKIIDLIRLTDVKLDDLNYEKCNWGNILYISEVMLKFQKYVLLIGGLMGLLFGGFCNINNFLIGMLQGGCYGFFGTLIPVIISYIYYSIAKLASNKKMKKIDMDITIYQVLRKFYNNELTKAKNNELGFEPMETIDLDYENEYNKLIGRETVLEKKESKPKKLVLKKR